MWLRDGRVGDVRENSSVFFLYGPESPQALLFLLRSFLSSDPRPSLLGHAFPLFLVVSELRVGRFLPLLVTKSCLTLL